jgi:Family of unknown function (DUF5677)
MTDAMGVDEDLRIEAVAIDAEEIRKFTREDEFMELSVRLLVETSSFVCVAACTLGKSSSWDRDHAAVGGNMVRLYKLLHGLLDQLCQRRGELSFLFMRLIFESLINIQFLIKEFSPQLIDSYVGVSLRHERKLRGTVARNITDRGGIILPIEDRMLKSIDRTVRMAGVSLDEEDQKRPRDWGGKNVYEKAKAVGLEHAYLAAIGGGSNSIHGNWQEIAGHHLEWDDSTGRFTPNTDWAPPRPQVPLGLSRIIIETLAIYFPFMAGHAAFEEISPALHDILQRIDLVSKAHENYLAPKTWPEI